MAFARGQWRFNADFLYGVHSLLKTREFATHNQLGCVANDRQAAECGVNRVDGIAGSTSSQ